MADCGESNRDSQTDWRAANPHREAATIGS